MRKPARTHAERVSASSRARREREKQNLRETILKAAGAIFLQQGYEQFSLRKVAEQIGYSATTLYLYFKDKDELLFALACEGLERFCAALDAAEASSEDPIQQIEAIGRAYIAFGLAHPAHYRLMFMQRGDFLIKPLPGSDQLTIEAFGTLGRSVRRAMDLGAIRQADPVATANVLWAGVHGIVSLALTIPHLESDQVNAMVETYFQLTWEGLLARR
jgi:Transcriptional regulator